MCHVFDKTFISTEVPKPKHSMSTLSPIDRYHFPGQLDHQVPYNHMIVKGTKGSEKMVFQWVLNQDYRNRDDQGVLKDGGNSGKRGMQMRLPTFPIKFFQIDLLDSYISTCVNRVGYRITLPPQISVRKFNLKMCTVSSFQHTAFFRECRYSSSFYLKLPSFSD